jgi:tetratricopeptide (TPR) repeat protein
MIWGAPLPERVARPAAVEALLERALAAAPDNPQLHAKRAYLRFDRHDYAGAAESFEASLRLGGEDRDARRLLARCWNYLGRHRDALDLLAASERPSFERGRALMALGEAAAAEREYRAVLAEDPDDAGACRMLCRLLRRSGRAAEIVALCEALATRGAANAQMLYNWGWALASTGDEARARRLLPEPERIAAAALPVPAGFADLAVFNQALAEALLASPDQVRDFAEEDEANRGSRRVDNLLTAGQPALIGALVDALQHAVSAWRPAAREGFDPWPAARPAAARLRPWGLIQRGGEYEEGHIHPSGWASGVYYVRVPAAVAAAPVPGPGCIEFGPPAAIAAQAPDLAPALRYVPREGLLLLSPSHYQHRTIPSGVDEARISIAFDVVPDAATR